MKTYSWMWSTLALCVVLTGCDSGVTSDPIDEVASRVAGDVTDESSVLSKKNGNPRYDQDDNGIPDAGIYVNGHYTSVYAYDASGNWYWDLGDGRIQGTVGSVDDLDQSTVDVCNYVNNYRADFGNDPFMDARSRITFGVKDIPGRVTTIT